MASISSSRPRFAPTSTSRLSQRSSNAPANGPSTEYGRYSTAKAAAISHGPAARSGLNSRPPARPAWNRPSPNWLTARNSSSRQNSGRLRTDRHRATGACASTTRSRPVPTSRQPDPRTYPGGPRLLATMNVAGDMMVGWRSQRIRRISSPRRRTGCAREPCCSPTPICSSRRFGAASSTSSSTTTAARSGVVLNRPSETAVYNVLPQWAKLATKPKTMFIGGPVKRDAALCLATLRVGTDPTGVPGIRHVQGRMVMVDLDAEPEAIAPMVEGVRIFAGYSGWTIGQLEGEIERDDWIVLSALPSDVLVEPGWICGRGCCAVSRCRCRCWRPTRSTSAATKARWRQPISGYRTACRSRTLRTPRRSCGALARRRLAPGDELGALPAARRDGATAPTTHTTTTTSAVSGCGSTAPPRRRRVSIAAAASWVGATARRTWRTGSADAGTGQQPHAEAGGRDGGAQAEHRGEEHAPHNTRPARPRMGVPPGARLRPGDDGLSRQSQELRGAGWPRPLGSQLLGTGGAAGRPGAGGVGAGVGGPGTLTLKPLTIASVAPAAATTWSTLVVTASDTRYLSGPTVAMTWRRDVFSVIVVLAVGALDDRRRHAAEVGQRSVGGRQAGSCWLSMKPWLMASFGSKSPTSL